jgi:hypothetical protein
MRIRLLTIVLLALTCVYFTQAQDCNVGGCEMNGCFGDSCAQCGGNLVFSTVNGVNACVEPSDLQKINTDSSPTLNTTDIIIIAVVCSVACNFLSILSYCHFSSINTLPIKAQKEDPKLRTTNFRESRTPISTKIVFGR